MSTKLVTELLLAHHARRNVEEQPYIEYLQIISARDRVLSRFQKELQNPEQIEAETFRDFLKFEHNQHWTGLHRSSAQVCDDMPKLRRALSHLFDENIDIADRLNALDTKNEISITGISHGILTPLLLVRFPDKYGVWNGKSEAALKALKIWPTFKRGTSEGERYALLNKLFQNYSESTKLDLWSLDGLWHVVNEASKREADDAFECLEVVEKEYYEDKEYLEGKRIPKTGFAIERNAEARKKCIERFGAFCQVCKFDFFEFYGELGLNFIHVHHVEDLARSKGEQRVNPEKDLIPVCGNCHAMLHKGVTTARTIDELKEIIQSTASKRSQSVDVC